MKTKPMAHQIAALARSEGHVNFAYIMEQGTGKTWTTLADAERLYLSNLIDAVIVVAPNGVHSNWVLREIPTHMDVPTLCYIWRGTPTSKKALAAVERMYEDRYEKGTAPLRVFAMNIEAVNFKNGYEALERFVNSFRCLFVVDESTRIKNPAAQRTKKTVKLGRVAKARRILSGTPITKAPTDLYSQFDFLKSGLLGTTSYRAFVAEYAVLLDPNSNQMRAIMRKLGGKVMPQVVAEDANGNKMWKNLGRLSDMIAPHSFRVRKEDCLTLPPKVYQVINFEMTPEQRKIYERLKDDYNYVYDPEGDALDMSYEAIAARTKMKQVTSGFINVYGEPVILEADKNPRMEAFKEAIEDLDGSFIVWAIYEEEIKQIIRELESRGIVCAAYYGATSKEDRERIIDGFQSGEITAFVGHAAAAGIGITLTKAETAIYYSCSFDNELRLQSEDRCHRIGTKHTVVYIDLVAEDSVDEDVMKSLAVKTQIAEQVIDRKSP